MQILSLLVIFESVVFYEEISCETRTLYSIDQAHRYHFIKLHIFFEIVNLANCIRLHNSEMVNARKCNDAN